MKYILFIFLCSISKLTFGWQRYEKPIKLATPNKDGIYEFELIIAHKMTMARGLKYGKIGVLDYEPDTEEWWQRNGDQLSPCNDTDVFIKKEENDDMRDMVLMDVIQLDGLHHRMITINGKTPGDAIVVPLGAKVVLRVKNRLNTESITLHVHGLDKRGLWWTDGVSHVQQCPITVGDDFTYRFIADAPGTHWYHGHLASDRGEGMLGGFVVKNPDETVPDPANKGKRLTIKRDYYVMLQDWSVPWPSEQHYNLHDGTMKWVSGMDGERRGQCWAPTRTYDGSNVGGSVPMSSFLMGDKGWHNPEDQRTRPSKLPLATYLISKGEDILMRFVNGGVAQEILIWLEDHQFTIVAADGVEVKPVTVDALVIYSGERYDVLIHGLKNPERKVYRFILETMESIHWNWGPYEPFKSLGNLEYDNVNGTVGNEVDWEHKNCTLEHKCLIFNCPFGRFADKYPFECFSPHLLENAKEVQDMELIKADKFDKDFDERFINMHFDSHVDGYMFAKPHGMPYYYNDRLDDIAVKCDPEKCDRANHAKYDHTCDCFIHYYFKLNSIVQMTIYNMGDGGKAGTGYSHPFHMHGTHFAVMKIAYPDYFPHNGTIKSMNKDLPCEDVSKRCLDLKWTNQTWLNGRIDGMQKAPSYRDTILIPTGGYTVIRFRADNPGWWFAHCHLMLHHMGGTAFAFRIGEHDEIPKPPPNFPRFCGIFHDYDIPSPSNKTGNAM